MNTFGERLREERELLDKNQTEFGALGGVLKGAQINYEQDKRQPDAAYLASIAAAGADVLYILTGQRGGAAPAPALKPDEAALLDNYRHCSTEGKNAVKSTVSCLAQLQGVKKGKAA